ncbi:hypothetical protein DFH06DRAFT_1040341 [Mycena polygramma]|nr:hypothetical protein DFH06DRAFT_1040341 [Mycena polygramma]
MSDPTLLDVFRAHVATADVRERHVVECADEYWTYDDLDVISTGLALDFGSQYGSRPIVAIIAENLPYTFALHLAVWKLGGIVAPIDYHTPAALLEPMLAKVSPSVVVVPCTEITTLGIVLDSGFPLQSFTAEGSTMTALSQRFMNAFDLSEDLYPAPDPTSVALYLFTSSASKTTNIKCVPLTHRTLMTQSHALLQWNRKTYPTVSFQHLRVLGWGLFSHMLAAHDISTHVFLTGGCYIFGLTPSGYYFPGNAEQESVDVSTAVLRAMEKYRPECFAAVPWMFEGIKDTIMSEPEAERREELLRLLRNFKLLLSGGSPTSAECIRWAQEQSIPLVLSFGMTELGGSLFSRVPEADGVDVGWPIEDCIIPDAQFTLVDNEGNPHNSEGELHISSRIIARGYLDYQDSPDPFVVAPDGVITFKTGDRYAKYGSRIKWLGRKDDFVQLTSGEMVDPRVLEKILDACPSIARSCVIGNNFLTGPSQFLCALIELPPDVHLSVDLDISRAVRSVNRELAPPLRISWSRVLILDEGEQIPMTRKGLIWRKKLEALYGSRLAALLSPSNSAAPDSAPPLLSQTLPSQDFIRDVVLAIVANVLRISSEDLQLNADSTFAELGMDSTAALVIVGQLNERFDLNFPRNACHTHVDLNSLTVAISNHLRHVEGTAHPRAAVFTARRLDPSNDVVIVGQAVRLPGDLDTPAAFWEALVDMREDLLVPIPQDRWDHASFLRQSGEPSMPGDISFSKAGFIEIASFDNQFFGISAAEAVSVFPAARLVLETTFQALENANIPISRLKGTDTGVFTAGSMDTGYSHLIFASMGFGAYTRFHGTGAANSASCGRLSYLLDVHGPSVSIETACSSGMVAFDQAVQYLRTGRAETAIVSGANTQTWPGSLAFLTAQKMASPNSRCSTFASDADGYVPAEGAVSLILKTRTAALRDGDTILAAIKATDTKHNGRTQGLIAPNAAAHADLQRSLLAMASLSPSDIDFIETHGTGTSIGDLIEISGINAVFRGSHTPEKPLVLGAAKTCIGHTESVAGLVGIVKAIKQLSTGKVPGLSSLSGGKLNPEIDTSLVPLLFPSSVHDLPPPNELGMPPLGLVVAYGFAGTLAGTILEAPPVSETKGIENIIAEPLWMIFTVSAKSPDALHSYLRLYLDFCAKAPSTDFRSICYTSCVGRELYRYRFSCVVKDLDGLVHGLNDRLSRFHSSPNSTPRIILAFPGQGSQFYGMANALAGRFPEFREIITSAATMASSLVNFDVLSLILGLDEPTEEINKSVTAQICIFVYQYSVGQFLRKINITPDAVIGNSLGEISAAVEAGALSYELGLQFVVARAKMLSSSSNLPAGMVAIDASAVFILNCIKDLHLVNRVVISVFSSPNNHVVSGELDALAVLVAHLRTVGTRATFLNVDQGFHSYCIDPALPILTAWIDDHQKEFRPLELPLFSTVLGELVPQGQYLGPRHWVDHARNPVHFEQAAAQIKHDKWFKTACILDVGPTPTAWAALQVNNISEATLLSSAAKKRNDQELAFLRAIASLTEYGANPDFARLFGAGIQKTNIPTYPFQRQRHYPSFVPSRSGNFLAGPTTASLVVDESLYAVLNDHRINGDVVLPGSAMVDVFAQVQPQKLLDIRFHRPWVLQSSGKSGNMDFHGDGFSLSTDGDRLCSGNFSPAIAASKRVPSVDPVGQNPATHVLTGDEVYRPFVKVQFGPLFRNISSLRIWADHADGVVEVKPTANPAHDRIRALDACLHMLGACWSLLSDNPSASRSGAFLPMDLHGFSSQVDAFPPSFICRYRLPVVLERNKHVVTTAFEAVSHSGELLASCVKYSVAWVNMDSSPSPISPGFSFQQVWIPKELDAKKPAAVSKVFYLGNRLDWIDSLFDSVDKYMLGQSECQDGGTPSKFLSEESFFDHILENVALALQPTIILDVTGMADAPESPSFFANWQSTLRLMKALGRSKTRSFTFIVLSTSPVSVGAKPLSVLGPTIQGMLRVFRTELGLHSAYGIEFPEGAAPADIAEAVKAELSGSKDNMVSFRHSRLPGELSVGLRRFVPELQPMIQENMEVRLSGGVAVIVGMGSIGSALGSKMIAAGSSTVAFIGRRPPTEGKIAQRLPALANASDQFSYVQGDAADLTSLRLALKGIVATHGTIKSIFHTAACVKDATIDSVTPGDFDLVLRPKVHGAYNLHLLTVELALQLDSFVLFSSISVPLGNQGQVAYVAANTFLDSLAAHRRSIGLPAVSLQLGPWESQLVDNLAPFSAASAVVQTISPKDGLPLIVRAASSPVPVQVIAALDVRLLSRIPVLANDSLFANLVAAEDASKPHAMMTREAVAQTVQEIMRGILELTDTERLELHQSLSACGIDSIAFGQIRTAIMKQLGVDVPLVYLSDAFCVGDMIGNVQEGLEQLGAILK